jgi:hypothetical protein
MPVLIASPTARRREERLLMQARLKQLEAGIDRALEMAREVGSNAPSQPTAEDAFYLAEILASNGNEGLPKGSHVETQAVDTTTPLQRPYGRTYTTVCTTVTIFPLQPMTPAEALLAGLLSTSGRLNHVAYEAAVKATPGVIEGKLIGPRDLMLAHQEAARAKYPRLWSA